MSPACTCLSCPAHGEAAAAALVVPGPEPGGAGRFAGSGRLFGEITSWLDGEGAGGLAHAGLEDELDGRSRELARQLYQNHLDLRAAREQRRGQVTGLDGVARIRAEAGHTRVLSTVFGPVTVSRMSFEQACAQVRRQTGSMLGKRQCQELARAAAADVTDFYAESVRFFV